MVARKIIRTYRNVAATASVVHISGVGSVDTITTFASADILENVISHANMLTALYKFAIHRVRLKANKDE